jgi:hypothetical protein
MAWSPFEWFSWPKKFYVPIILFNKASL